MNKLSLYILFVIAMISCREKTEKVDLLSHASSFKDSKTDTLLVGTPIIYTKFKTENKNDNTWVLIQNSYGTKLLEAKNIMNERGLQVPDIYVQKKGLLEISIFQKNEIIIYKKYYLKADPRISKLENYYGEKFIHLDGNQEPEIITLVLDAYDNVTPTSEVLNYEAIQNQNSKTNQVVPKEGIGIYYMKDNYQVGAKSLSVHYADIHSEEERFYIMSGHPTSFQISYHLSHNLADGNTIYELKTTPIRDQFGNLINDGSQVRFDITDDREITIQKYTSTFNGVAKLNLQHPMKKNTLKVTAICFPSAKSNTLSIPFVKAIEKISFVQNDHHFIIGPISTLNSNYIPHASKVMIQLQDTQGKIIKTWNLFTEEGRVEFSTPKYIPHGKYTMVLKSMGHTEIIENIVL